MKPVRLLLISAAVLVTAACADSSTSGIAAPPVPAAATTAGSAPTSGSYDAEPYCALTRQLEAEGEDAFADLGRSATRGQFREAERNFVLDNVGLLGGLVGAAPSHLADDLETFLAAMRQRGGLEVSGVSQSEASDAEERILSFEKRHC